MFLGLNQVSMRTYSGRPIQEVKNPKTDHSYLFFETFRLFVVSLTGSRISSKLSRFINSTDSRDRCFNRIYSLLVDSLVVLKRAYSSLGHHSLSQMIERVFGGVCSHGDFLFDKPLRSELFQ